MHPALFPFSQPKTSHQSSKLHPDPDCAVLCRYPMWRPFPSLFRNNWSYHRHSDAASTLPHPRQHLLVRSSDTATTSTLLDSRCWISFSVTLPHLELSQSDASAIQAFQTKRLSVALAR